MWIVLASVAALGADVGPLSPSWHKARTVKVDVFVAVPGVVRYGSDWRKSDIESWTAVLSCIPVDARAETCSFVDGVWWGVVPEGTGVLTAEALPAPGELTLTWTPRGRLASYDLTGDRSAFWTEASNALVRLLFRDPNGAFKPDAQRKIGQDIEHELARTLGGALELELSKTGGADKPWTLSQAPWSGRRWVDGTAGTNVKITARAADDGTYALSGDGAVNEMSGTGSQISVETKMRIRATFDPKRGQVVRSSTETVVSQSSVPLDGHLRSIAVVAPWSKGEPTTPAAMPTFELVD